MSSRSALLAVGCFLMACRTTSGWQNPEMVEARLRIKIPDPFKWQELKPDALNITFNPFLLNKPLVLTLHGYSERNLTKISKVKTPFTLLSTVPIPDTVISEIDVASLDLKCVVKDDECNKYDMGYLEISQQTRENHTTTPSIISPIIPLGWFLQKNFMKENFDSWAYGKCRTWHNSEANDTEIQNALKNVSCPITMHAANNDPGWYLKSGYLAGFPSEEWKSGKPLSALPAQTCYYSAIENVPPSMHASPASLCCYRNSNSALLQKEFMATGGLNVHGSSVLRSHPGGSDSHHEHYLQGQVPYLSHWYWDKLPYLYCCQWWNGTVCAEYYMKLRPAPRVQRKPVGTQAAYIVESHLHAINAADSNDFCPQVGEFWLVRSPAIEVQMRNYVVSSYKGPLPGVKQARSNFEAGGSKSGFVTAIAMRSLDSPDIVVELICAEGEYRSFVQATNRKSSVSTPYEGLMSRGLGRNVVVGDVFHDPVGTQSKVYSFLVKHHAGRVGLVAFVIEPLEELMSLYLTISSELLDNTTGLVKGGDCLEHKITDPAERLFSSMCDNCEDFEKYSTSRPPYFEDIDDYDMLKFRHINCSTHADVALCNYLAWSTEFPMYYDSVTNTRTRAIEPMIHALSYRDWDACQSPSMQIVGLLISENQSLNESATLTLKCVPPLKGTSEGAVVTCKRSGQSLAFDFPSDFKCNGAQQLALSSSSSSPDSPTPEAASEEAIAVEVKQQQARKADESYTKQHYTPEAEVGATSGARKWVAEGPIHVVIVSAAFAGLVRLSELGGSTV